MGAILLYVHIGELCVRARLDIVDYLAVDLLLRTSVLDNYIWTVVLGEHQLIPWHSTPVVIIKSHNVVVSSSEETIEKK